LRAEPWRVNHESGQEPAEARRGRSLDLTAKAVPSHRAPRGLRVHGADPPGPAGEDREESEAILKAKYLDYCSAQLADLLLYLTPDEIFLVAQKASHESGASRSISYMDMMQVATQWLSSRIVLPPFEIWVDDYREHPDRYEAYFMGLWESDVGAARET
jgi:hypothetical protein